MANRPKPTALRVLEGNPGKRAINRNEPKPTGTPTCPKHLDKAARVEWKRISVDLSRLGLLTSVDRAALAAYCAAWSRWITAEENVQKFGAVIKSPKSGYPVQNPYVGIANTSLQLMHRFATEFGLTPSSRVRLSVDAAPPSSGDAFTDFMAALGAGDTEDEETELQPNRK